MVCVRGDIYLLSGGVDDLQALFAKTVEREGLVCGNKAGLTLLFCFSLFYGRCSFYCYGHGLLMVCTCYILLIYL